MKSVKSERVLLSAGDQPKAQSSRWADLKQKGIKLYEDVKCTATELVQAASVKVTSTRVYLNKQVNVVRVRVHSVIVQGKQRASKLAEPIVSRALRAVHTAQSAKQFVFDLAASVKSRACLQYQELKSSGLRVYSVEKARLMGNMAKKTAAESRSKVTAAYDDAVATGSTLIDSSCKQARSATSKARLKTAELSTKTLEVVKDRNFQATAAGAAGGAAALGASGGVAGLTAGSVMGAAVGVVPALFTFGLSIPICAALGGGAGLVVGTAVGGAAGALGGGAAGYGLHAKSGDLREGAQKTAAKMSSSASFVKGKVYASANFVGERASEVRQRLVGGCTGGTGTNNQ